MTVFGIDVSHNQQGLSLAAVKSQGYDFVIAKATEGAHFKDPLFHDFRHQARQAHLMFAAYHFLRSDSPAGAQADNLAAQLEGHDHIPVMIDCEPTKDSSPDMGDVTRFIAACRHRNLRVTILYLPRFHWEELGRPSLDLDVALMQSLFGKNQAGFGSVLFPGNTSSRWDRMGGKTPDLLQFGSKGRIDGFHGDVDVDAFRGHRGELVAAGLFTVPTGVPAAAGVSGDH